VVGHALEEENGVDVLLFHGRWDLDTSGGVVEDRANAAAGEGVDDLLGLSRGDGDDADLGGLLAKVDF